MLTPSELVPFVELVRTRNSAVPMPERAIRLLESGDVHLVLDEVRPPTLTDDSAKGIEDEVESWLAAGYRVITLLDTEYPDRLRTVRESLCVRLR